MSDEHYAALCAAQLALDAVLKRMREIRSLFDNDRQMSVDTRAELAREWGELEQRQTQATARIRELQQRDKLAI